MPFCPKCGYENPKGSNVCGRCGMRFAVNRTPVHKEALIKEQKVSFSASFYEFYIELRVFIDLAIGGALGFVAGKFCDFMENREDGLYAIVLTTIGIIVGWAVGKINTMIPKLLLIIAKDSEQLCGKIDADTIKDRDESDELLAMRDRGLISDEEYERYRKK